MCKFTEFDDHDDVQGLGDATATAESRPHY